ncbi:MAG: S41 family peptidase [Calditrichaceae bacterium]|nr:S41 family peptidase [Calditrichaceae bacterium]RQV95959.1 MAG: S41 family peptidase [Calditrichota bacterium]
METKLNLKMIRYVLTGLFLLISIQTSLADDADYYQKLKKSWTYMRQVYEQLNQHYMEEIDPYPLVKAGIDGMLNKLDPYTVFMEDDGERQLRIITTGKYGGLGLEIGLRNKKVTVISPIEDSPAKKIGIQAGDIIIEIDGKSISDWNIDKVSAHLRGDIGTKVALKIIRPGWEKPFEVTMIRDLIVIEDVNYAGFVAPGIAYVSLTGFTEKAASEMKKAISDLKDEDEIKAFILDLRRNPGGLLSSAVEVVNIFVPKGELVVYTKGYREKETKFFTKDDPLLKDIPLAVLVDEGSASASEIVAGALQDLDRAVIIGEPTFGKGLVQKVYPIDENSDARIKITTAKYFVPSGRCIQRQEYNSDASFIVRDSLSDEDEADLYFTRNKRMVYDKGGVYPDVLVKKDSLDFYLVDMIRSNLFFDFAVKYHRQYPEWKNEYETDDKILTDFESFIKEQNYTLKSIYDDEIESLEKQLIQLDDNQAYVRIIDELKIRLQHEKQEKYNQNRQRMREILLFELAEKYNGKDFRYQLALKSDAFLKEATTILSDIPHYNDVLAIR